MSKQSNGGLLPCPFCGKRPLIVCPDNSYGSAVITCGDDNACPVGPMAEGDLEAGETFETAIAAWNTRTPPPTSADVVERVHVVFDGPPGPEAGRFVECETPDGRSINAGDWHKRADGLWELCISLTALTHPPASADVDATPDHCGIVQVGDDFYAAPADEDASTPLTGDDVELCARLRSYRYSDEGVFYRPLLNEAADRIAALAADNARLREALDARGVALTVAAARLRDLGDPDAANEARVALQQKDDL